MYIIYIEHRQQGAEQFSQPVLADAERDITSTSLYPIYVYILYPISNISSTGSKAHSKSPRPSAPMLIYRSIYVLQLD